MLVHIKEEQFELSINQWDDITSGLFKVYADWRCNENNVSKITNVSNENNIPNESTNANTNINANSNANAHSNANTISNQQKKTLKPFVYDSNVRMPECNMGRKPLIEEWIHRTKKLEFTLEEYFEIYPKQKQNIEMVYTHISGLITKKLLIQIGENKFKIMV